ncbi:nucleotidyltransferase family protein [Criblamydia sequanensis]|uniref:Nucleotidyltransferase family protein n=1 Tax=Candidatus Criblamydia sequanensis CRIB-18 TaxID=1437425 RepID=A0A090D2K9_9BACT|nr:nucleotidyltransferase family protein [Criblamydia sequanensis]CDR34458.1 hypothetical protein CSEC_1645 [Criblamydia sequanensis CRIB-18]
MSHTIVDGWLPNKHQKLLLDAALIPNQSIEKWEEWLKEKNLEDIDEASYRLLPLIWHRLHHLKYQHPLMSRLKGVYLHTWAKNKRLFYHGEGIIKKLQDKNIPVLLIKGPALLLTYQDFALRPMNDFDLMVKRDQFELAIQVLQENGWSNGKQKNLSATSFKLYHAVNFTNEEKIAIDLHQALVTELVGEKEDASFWQLSKKVQLRGSIEPYLLSDEDLFFQTCIHGLRWNPVTSLRWVLDACTILNSKKKFDWERVLKLCESYRLKIPVWKALFYLKENYIKDLDTTIIQQFSSTTEEEEREYRFYQNPRGLEGKWGVIWTHALKRRRFKKGFFSLAKEIVNVFLKSRNIQNSKEFISFIRKKFFVILRS